MKHSTLMDTDDLEPIIKPKEIDFDTLSIEELREYIEQLKREIERVKSDLEKKQMTQIEAEKYFK